MVLRANAKQSEHQSVEKQTQKQTQQSSKVQASLPDGQTVCLGSPRASMQQEEISEFPNGSCDLLPLYAVSEPQIPRDAPWREGSRRT